MKDKFEQIIIPLIITLAIFITGIQIGIHHGKELQKQEYYDSILAD